MLFICSPQDCSSPDPISMLFGAQPICFRSNPAISRVIKLDRHGEKGECDELCCGQSVKDPSVQYGCAVTMATQIIQRKTNAAILSNSSFFPIL